MSKWKPLGRAEVRVRGKKFREATVEVEHHGEVFVFYGTDSPFSDDLEVFVAKQCNHCGSEIDDDLPPFPFRRGKIVGWRKSKAWPAVPKERAQEALAKLKV